VSALLAPVLGTLADLRSLKKTLLAAFALLGAASTAALFRALPGDGTFALWCFALANVGAVGSVVFYDALLPHVAREDEMDRLSASGYALGYLGGGLCLALNLAWILMPARFGLPAGGTVEEATLPARLAFLFVGVWWLLFTLPVLLQVSEPPRSVESDEGSGAALVRTTFERLRETFRELRRYRQAFLLLVAFLLYNDGILTIIRMAGMYASAKELDRTIVLGTFLVIQFVGIPCSFLFGGLAGRVGVKRMIAIGLVVYCLITLLAFFMSTAWHFVALGLLVALVQGGTQALSRSLFASLIPRHRTGEFFGLFGVGEKFAGIFGPLLYGLAIHWSGSAQGAILSVIPFFLVGGALLLRLDVEAGRRMAREAERDVRVVRKAGT